MSENQQAAQQKIDSDEKSSCNEFSEVEPIKNFGLQKKNQEKDDAIRFRGQQDPKVKNEEAKDKSNVEHPPMQRNMPISIKYSNFTIRTTWTIIMLGGFIGIIAAGHAYCVIIVFLLTLGIFKEITSLKRHYDKEQQIPFFSFINWYFFSVAIFFFFGRALIDKLPSLFFSNRIFIFIANYHSFSSFMIWVLGFLTFVMTLKKGYYRYQFRAFASAHFGIVLIVIQTSFIVQNLFQGLIWFITPCILVISNDIFAYIFGFFFGKRKLIELSPKKTWEGFIGGFISSTFFSIVFSMLFQMIPQLTCTQTELTLVPFDFSKCTVQGTLFQRNEIILHNSLSFFGLKSIWLSDFQIHALWLSLFASLIAPFGGFFASGFKRAIKIKDFADVIPGHGGITDRMDCQLLMATFSYVYINQIVLSLKSSLSNLALYIAGLNINDQITIYKELGKMLVQKHVPLNITSV